MAESATPSLPQFDPKKVYLVRGDSLNKIVDTAKMYRPRIVQDGGLKVVSQSDQGTFLATDLKTLDLVVCIDGVATTKTFYVAA